MISKIFVIIWQLVIFLFSSQPATESDAVSDGFTEVILKFFFRGMTDAQISDMADALSFVVRKCAHFSIYFVLGMLMLNCIMRCVKFKRKLHWSLLFCALYSVCDEIHQLFVPGRAGRILDVCIDSMGSLCGILLLWILMNIYGRITSRRNNFKL